MSARLIRLAAAAALTAALWPAAARAQDHDHSAHQAGQAEAEPAPRVTAPGPAPREPIPPLTDADRAAAFPDVGGHTVHDEAIHRFVLFDRLEWRGGGGERAAHWDTGGWVGGDLARLWFRTEGDVHDGRLGEADVQVFYGRAVARWWDVVAGVRHDDARDGPARTWAAVGLTGLAPHWFEVDATAYLGESARTALRLEAEYELLLTNRLVLQPVIELDVYGKDDPERGIGAGLSETETGLRLRYELRREIAPYVGVTWHRTWFGTRDAARLAGERTGGAQVAVGLRAWF